jgi:hypothetical protein
LSGVQAVALEIGLVPGVEDQPTPELKPEDVDVEALAAKARAEAMHEFEAKRAAPVTSSRPAPPQVAGPSSASVPARLCSAWHIPFFML